MTQKLFMVLLGCRPRGRHTEQHDVFFGIAGSLYELKEAMQRFWPGAKLHIDAWREVTNVDGFRIEVNQNNDQPVPGKSSQLFFINLGGYKKNEFEEFHYKMLAVASGKNNAVNAAKSTAFYKHTSLPGKGVSHIDDRYGVDADEVYAVKEILPAGMKKNYRVIIAPQPVSELPPDEIHLGYLQWRSLTPAGKKH